MYESYHIITWLDSGNRFIKEVICVIISGKTILTEAVQWKKIMIKIKQ